MVWSREHLKYLAQTKQTPRYPITSTHSYTLEMLRNFNRPDTPILARQLMNFHTVTVRAYIRQRTDELGWLCGTVVERRFEPPFRVLRGNVHGSSMAQWKARC